MDSFMAQLSFSDLVFGDNGSDINVAIGMSLDRPFVLIYLLHLLLNGLRVDVRRDCLSLEPFHYLSIFLVDPLSFPFFVDEIE